MEFRYTLANVTTFVVKFLFLMVFPALISPTVLAETVSFATTITKSSTTHFVSPLKQHASFYTTFSAIEAEETETDPAEKLSSTSPIQFAVGYDTTNFAALGSESANDSPHLKSILSYLSLFSLSPPLVS